MTQRQKLTNPIGRATEEWIGKTANTKVPTRVEVRVFERAGGRCEECTRKLHAGDPRQIDHRIALINGGENRETNLQLLCGWCHKGKTKQDVAEKSKTAAVKAKHLGFKKPKHTWPKRKLGQPYQPNVKQLDEM